MLDKFKELGAGLQLDAQIAQFLNTTRNNTSMLGVRKTPAINTHISRTILS
jgi:hypothetical protein